MDMKTGQIRRFSIADAARDQGFSLPLEREQAIELLKVTPPAERIPRANKVIAQCRQQRKAKRRAQKAARRATR
jgi:hypothetical protein